MNLNQNKYERSKFNALYYWTCLSDDYPVDFQKRTKVQSKLSKISKNMGGI